jgi:NAD(P)-dependent dehydrogenase (short-subunit alcohol dehydrogenase family)
MDLKGRTFIITGASMGIGRAIALELADSGVNLVLNARGEVELSAAARECESAGVTVEQVPGDAAIGEVAHALVQKAVAIGGFYGFVHNAGVVRPGQFLWELPEEHFQEVLGANLIAGYQLIRFAVPELLKPGEGLAVFLGSGAAEIAMPGIATYCVAKAAEEHLARQLASEAPQITTFVYRPGVVDTRMQQQAREAEGGAAHHLHREFRAYKDQGALISPEDAARSIVRIMKSDPRRYHGRI